MGETRIIFQVGSNGKFFRNVMIPHYLDTTQKLRQESISPQNQRGHRDRRECTPPHMFLRNVMILFDLDGRRRLSRSQRGFDSRWCERNLAKARAGGIKDRVGQGPRDDGDRKFARSSSFLVRTIDHHYFYLGNGEA